MTERTIFIGDIQGCFDEFIHLLQKCNYNEINDTLYLAGDVINRGPKSKEVLDYLCDHPDVGVVRGNHEHYFLKWLDLSEKDSSGSFNKCYQQLESDIKKYKELMSSWPYFIEDDNWLMVHAGCWPNLHPKDTEVKLLCNMREIEFEGKNAAWFEFYEGQKTVIFGHWAQKGIVNLPLIKGLDSGCVYGNSLSAYILEENRIISTPALRMWYDPIKKCENW